MSPWAWPAPREADSPPLAAAGDGAAREDLLPAATWARIFTGPTRLLVLSFERVLAPFLTPRRPPRLAPSLTRALRAFGDSPDDALVVHSAGGLSGFRDLLDGTRAHLIGEHGWEEQSADGWKVVHQLPARTRRRLEAAARAAAMRGWSPGLIPRRCSLALRTTAWPADRAGLIRREAEDLWSPAFETDGLGLHASPDGIELRPTERGAGAAVSEAARRLWPSAAVVCLDIAEATARDPDRMPPAQAGSDTGRPGAWTVRVGSARDALRLIEQWHDRRARAVAAGHEPARAAG